MGSKLEISVEYHLGNNTIHFKTFKTFDKTFFIDSFNCFGIKTELDLIPRQP